MDLVEVALAFAEDNTQMVKNLMNEGHLTKVSDKEAKQWSEERGLTFRMLIVQPFILIQKGTTLH